VPDDAFERTLAVLEELATPADRPGVAMLRQRLADRRLRVLVAGEAKRGKSTLINRLLGRDVLPTGVTPVTAIATTVRPATDGEYLDVTFLDGRTEQREVADLAALVTERGNPENKLGVGDVVLRLSSPLLEQYGVELVDTPGTGSVFVHNTSAAEQVYESLDAAVVVVSADPPISAAERDLLVNVNALAVRTFVVLNKADQLDAADLREAREFTEVACERALGRPVIVYPTSARGGDEDPGYRAFAEVFRAYLVDRAGADLATALRRHFARLASSMLDAVLLTERSLQLAASSSADQVRLFAERVASIAARRRELGDQAWLAQRRVNRVLDESGHERIAQLNTQITQDAVTLLDSELAELSAEQLETGARAAVVRLIEDGVEKWRGEMISMLERELDTICLRGLDELDAQLADLRGAASDLLGVQLAVARVESPLRSDPRFRYAFERGVGWELPLAGLVRKLAPGRRKRARQRVLDEVPELVDRQMGRVRSDLAQRFKLSVGEVVKQLGAEHDEILGRVQYALDEVARISDAAGSERDERLTRLGQRGDALRDVLAKLDS